MTNNVFSRNETVGPGTYKIKKQVSSLLNKDKVKVIGVMDVLNKHKSQFKLISPFYNGDAPAISSKKFKKQSSASKIYFNEDNTSFSRAAIKEIDKHKYAF